MKLTERQEKISHIVETEGPITGAAIAEKLSITRAAIRSDLSVLTMMGILDARPKVGYYHVGHMRKNPLMEAMDTYSVKDVCSQPVVVTEDMSLYDATITMFTEDVGTLLVGAREGDFFVLQGILSRKDLLRASMGNASNLQLPVSMMMTPASKVVVVEPEDPALLGAQKLMDYEIDCLPVVEKVQLEGRERLRIVGRFSKTNVTRLLVECCTK